ncbi:hypothetical protein EAF00_003218 [Botryotinia globosa]|nr:hypothetical protein EAF00_003218 [Botryotinia globosa]
MSSIFSSMLALLPSMAPFASYEAMSTSLIPSVCRCFPGDECYPGISDWDGFNQTIGGKLIATVPIAAVCHNDQFATYDAVLRKEVVVGSWVSSQQAYEFADANNGILVAGNCPTVALAGGYWKGGGHGPLATKFGLAVDQVLEWQVVTGVGTLVTATPTQNPDLFWALSGGGGGTYGIVLSATMKFHPKVTSTSSATLQLPLQLQQKGLPHIGRLSKVSSSLLEYYHSVNFGANVSNANTAGRLLPRSVVQNDTDSFISVLQTTVDNGYLMAGVTLEVNKTVVPNAPEISDNPYWRKTLMNAVFGTYLTYTDFSANFQSQNFMTSTIGSALAALNPDGAVYLDEADFQQPDWKGVLWCKL